ncbi:MAG: Spy/CpxP family protein refolding chaperone [Rhodoferax sp.]|nr:Spy/CpxP family protein refolding chaperone [Rhodoferax sp.]
MKPWIKRSLFGFAGAAIVAGSLGACAAHRSGWGGDPAEFRARMVERVGGKLDLDAAQKQKLNVLAEKLQAQRTAIRDAGGAGGTRSQFQSLFAGARLDQAGALKMIEEKTAAVRSGSPEVVAAAADFFDNLNPAQQQKVRDFMAKGGRRWGRRG